MYKLVKSVIICKHFVWWLPLRHGSIYIHIYIYAVVYCLNCRKLKDSLRHRSAQWKIILECFRDICNIGVGYEWAKGYYRAKIRMSDASGINEIKAVKKTGLCYKCGGSHLQCECTSNGNKKFWNKPATQQLHKCNCTNKFDNNKTSKNMFPTGTLLCQASHPITSGKDMSASIDIIKHFLGKLGEKYSFKKKLHTQHDSTPSAEEYVHEVMQAVMA